MQMFTFLFPLHGRTRLRGPDGLNSLIPPASSSKEQKRSQRQRLHRPHWMPVLRRFVYNTVSAATEGSAGESG